jgi:hypothetical protein
MWSSCKQQYKLKYIDELSQSTSNINLFFGTAMHEVLQHYIDVCLRVSKSQADKSINLKESLTHKMREQYLKESVGGTLSICTKDELVEFLNDGILILEYFQKSKHFNKFFDLKYDELIAIEQPINVKITEGVNFIGFIDLVVRDTFNNRYKIIDFKTSTKGWSSYQKKDNIKNAQILLYKKFLSQLKAIPEEDIDVVFFIVKRKIFESDEFIIPRIQQFKPSHGKLKIKQAYQSFSNFLLECFNTDGTYKELQYPKNVTKLCNWCPFNTNPELCDKNNENRNKFFV